MSPIQTVFSRLWIVFLLVPWSQGRAETLFYALENVVLSDGRQMTGAFSWTFQSGAFEDGEGRFVTLGIPWTAHDQTDLSTEVDPGGSIEITLEGSVHDDGVDITLFLEQPFTPDGSASLDLERSKYEIGGNGFHDGSFLSGRIVPITLRLRIAVREPGRVQLSWPAELLGFVLRDTGHLRSEVWTDAGGNGTNTVSVSASAPTGLFRLEAP